MITVVDQFLSPLYIHVDLKIKLIIYSEPGDRKDDDKKPVDVLGDFKSDCGKYVLR